MNHFVTRRESYGVSFSRGDVEAYTKEILAWWSNHETQIPALAKAASIMFAFSTNSAACERVFSLLKLMFGPQQEGALADYIQAALMLRYNEREVLEENAAREAMGP